LNTSVVSDEARNSIRKHVVASLEYMGNAQLMLTKQEAGKASEMLWGGVSQALEALAESRNRRLKEHRSLRFFVAEVSRETGDKGINNAFYQAENLHTNFHSVDMDVQSVAANVDSIRELVSKLLSMIPPELTSQKEA